MAHSSPTSSPGWDIRNQGFVSPGQLQQWKQQQRASTHEFSSTPEQTQPSQPPAQSPQHQVTRSPPPMGPAQSSSAPSTPKPPPNSAPAPPPTHTRTNSTFSFFKAKFQPHESPQPQQGTQPPPGYQQQRQQLVNVSHRKRNVLRRRSSDRPQEPSASSALPQSGPSEPSPSRASTAIARQSTSGPPPLHPEIRSIVNLTLAHGQKIYFSGPVVRRLERQPDGQKPVKDEGWRDVWAQLGGTTLSLWDMKEIDEASKQGRQVPPSYINVTDAVSIVMNLNFQYCLSWISFSSFMLSARSTSLQSGINHHRST